jgi:hypothetical protein
VNSTFCTICQDLSFLRAYTRGPASRSRPSSILSNMFKTILSVSAFPAMFPCWHYNSRRVRR